MNFTHYLHGGKFSNLHSTSASNWKQHKTALPKDLSLLHCDNFMLIHSARMNKHDPYSRGQGVQAHPCRSLRSSTRFGHNQLAILSPSAATGLQQVLCSFQGNPRGSKGWRKPIKVLLVPILTKVLGMASRTPKWLRGPQGATPVNLGWDHNIFNLMTRGFWGSFSPWRKLLAKSDAFVWASSLSWKGNSSFVIRMNHYHECIMYI